MAAPDEVQARPGNSRSVAVAVVATVTAVVGAAVGVALAMPGGDVAEVRSTTPPAAATSATAPAGLVVHVTLSRSVIHLGESVRVDYSWSDGDGELVDTNDVGPSAVHYRRNVPCRAALPRPRPAAGSGSWVFTPVRGLYDGPVSLPATIRVGLQVRTGGCAPVQDVTATQPLTLLPAVGPTRSSTDATVG